MNMKKLTYLFSIILLCCLSSCAESSEEPEMQYTGPWRIVFDEDFTQIHNDSEEFSDWFQMNYEYLWDACFLVNDSGYEWEYPQHDKVKEYYSKSYCGKVRWIMEIQKADEKYLSHLVKEFESFTIIEDESNCYDKFTASYGPLDN